MSKINEQFTFLGRCFLFFSTFEKMEKGRKQKEKGQRYEIIEGEKKEKGTNLQDQQSQTEREVRKERKEKKEEGIKNKLRRKTRNEPSMKQKEKGGEINSKKGWIQRLRKGGERV